MKPYPLLGRTAEYNHGAATTQYPVVWYLPGLICTQANFTENGEFHRACTEPGMIFVAPDTSPPGRGMPGDPEEGLRRCEHALASPAPAQL